MSAARGAWGGLLALALLSGCASLRGGAPESVEAIEAEGWAPLDAQDSAGTRQRALVEAQKKAVEKVTGVFLAASTRVDAAVAVRQKITADVKGTIRRYEVLGEKEEDGFYKIRIRAIVARPKPGQTPTPPDIPSEPPPGSPPVFVSITGLGEPAASAVRGKLQERGFRLAENEASQQPLLVLRGQARVYEIKDHRLGAFQSYRARLTLEAVESPAGAVVWRESREASALGVDAESASSQALENAAELAGLSAAEGLTAYLWKRF